MLKNSGVRKLFISRQGPDRAALEKEEPEWRKHLSIRLKELQAGRDVILAGTGSFIKDFEYLFSMLDVKAYLIDQTGDFKFSQKPIYSLNTLKARQLKNAWIIICSFEPQIWEQELYKRGANEKDIIYADELFNLLDETEDVLNKAKGRPLAVLGEGNKVLRVLDESHLPISAVITWNSNYLGGGV